MRTLLRYAAYPLVFGGAGLLLFTLAARGVAYWPAFPLVVLAGYALVALLERLLPYERAWLADHDGDTRADVLHLLVTQLLLQASVALGFGLRSALPEWPALWPSAAPMTVQILLAGLLLDASLYAMHRASHAHGLLWRLHAIHHSPERLYWLNGGRRHPLSALVLAGPGLTLLLLLGATPIAVAAWLALMSVHLAFQHANADYRLGPLRQVFAVAEMHRWHHKREFEDAQVNFGEVLLLWDWLFGSHHSVGEGPRAGAVGLQHSTVPRSYWGQLRWPLLKG